MGNAQNQYIPDNVSPPGVTLLEVLEAKGLTQAELADRTGRPRKTINEIVKGKAGLTPETAIQLERVLGVPASFWNARERQFRECLARKSERTVLEKQRAWLKGFPLPAMVERGIVQAASDHVEQARLVLNFFGVASPDQFDAVYGSKVEACQFRRSKTQAKGIGAVAVWLRLGEIRATELDAPAYDEDAFRSALSRIRALTASPIKDAFRGAGELCRKAGVALLAVEELPGMAISGATRWLHGERPVVQLTLRYKTDDQFWFTFFHESGHILLHGRKEMFLETRGDSPDDREREADAFAANLLIPQPMYQQLLSQQVTAERVRAFATVHDVAAGIVVGRLQHDKRIPFDWLNGLKRKLKWVDRTD